jgi:hypothetical protein
MIVSIYLSITCYGTFIYMYYFVVHIARGDNFFVVTSIINVSIKFRPKITMCLFLLYLYRVGRYVGNKSVLFYLKKMYVNVIK